MKALLPKLSVAALLLSATAAFAQGPLVGSWKFNAKKSNLAGDTITFAPAASGAITVTADGRPYTFKPDGSDTPTPTGRIAAWTKVDDSTWKEVVRMNTTVLTTNTYKLAADGKAFTVTSTGTKPDGNSFNDSATYTRVLAGKGFLGKWKSTKVDVTDLSGYIFKDNGNGTLTWNLPDYKATAVIKLDGKDYPATGPTVPQGITVSLTPAGTRRFTMTEKKDGKSLYKATEVVSADGKTLTETGSSTAVNEPSIAVYDKQ